MGAGQSKEETLYQAVQNSNHQAVKTLRRDGASLEWVDKEGRTPLILACTRGDLYDMVITLLNEGASLNAYRGGPHGGYPLHHAAKRGLEKTVLLLLSRGANPFQLNDDGLTPLDMARNKSHVAVVRIIEDRICLFKGMMRELSGPGFLEVLVPQFVTKKVWVVVLPKESDPTKPARNELVIYQTPKVGIPRTVISLSRADVEQPKFHHHDPTLIVTAPDKTAKVKFKFQSENDGDKAQLERLYKACTQGVRQTESAPASSVQQPAPGLSALARPPAPQLSGPTTPVNPPNAKKGEKTDYSGWADGEQSNYGGWGGPGTSAGAGPSRVGPSVASSSTTPESKPGASKLAPSPTTGLNSASSTSVTVIAPQSTPPAPSAPPFPQDGSISYPSVDTSPVQVNYTSAPAVAPTEQKADEKLGGQCVVCWDAPAEAICIPCGHLAGCMDCLSEIKSKNWGCPVCRATIDQVIKVFAV